MVSVWLSHLLVIYMVMLFLVSECKIRLSDIHIYLYYFFCLDMSVFIYAPIPFKYPHLFITLAYFFDPPPPALISHPFRMKAISGWPHKYSIFFKNNILKTKTKFLKCLCPCWCKCRYLLWLKKFFEFIPKYFVNSPSCTRWHIFVYTTSENTSVSIISV